MSVTAGLIFNWLVGWFVQIIRGENGIGIDVLHLVLTIVTFGFFQIVMPYLYNKQYWSRLLTTGLQLNDEAQIMSVARLKLGISQQ